MSLPTRVEVYTGSLAMLLVVLITLWLLYW